MKYITLLVVLVLLTSVSFAEEPHHQLVRVYILYDGQIPQLMEHGLDIVKVQPGEYVEVVTTQTELEALILEGFKVKVIIPDMEKYYKEQYLYAEPMGGFHTFDEMMALLNQYHQQYPNLITAPYSIGQSWENRDLWVVKISDNPTVDEDEPEVWYDGLTHAREPIGMQLLLYFIEHLLSNYGTDTTATYIVDNRELFLLPCANPDGYVYNQTTNPNGGGMWRKNRRDNGGGEYGVDLNRNYPFDWGHDNQGSSGNPGSSTYRGPSPASEPETQAIINYINNRHIAVSHSYHSYGDMVLLPWSADYNGVTPHHADFMAIGNQFAAWNGYTVGTAWQILYNVNGGSIDWHYGQQDEHYRIMAFSCEVGPSFWPAQGSITALCQENLNTNLHSALVADQYTQPALELVYADIVVDDSLGGNGNGSPDPGENIDLTVIIRNAGSDTAENIAAVISTLDPRVTITQAASAYPNLSSFEAGGNLIPYQISIPGTFPIGHEIPMDLAVNAAGGYTDTISFGLMVGDPLFSATGPDNYGYLAYDQNDGHRLGDYEWIEIDPAHGGSGTNLNFTQDEQTFQVNLPFTFTYYGQNYNQISVCSNGWVAMGTTNSTDYSNSRIPDSDGPPAMLAPFWEDLSPQYSGGVFTYYDVASRQFIVEYSRIRQYRPTTAYETFEVILFDPAAYPTTTGDGLIKFQFHTMSDITSITVGIENHLENDGLQILYNGDYHPNAHPIADSAAIVFTTGDSLPALTVTMTPHNPPIMVPAGGGSFNYGILITNNSAQPVTFDGWIEAILPNGGVYGPIILRQGLALNAGGTASRELTQVVPGVAPMGTYTYCAKVGDYPANVVGESSFNFTKLGLDAAAGGEWELFGFFDQVQTTANLPMEYSLEQNRPNPFNAETLIRFALPQAGKVSLKVYNIEGREVATLVQGVVSAGYHRVNWNAASESSGVYFFVLKTNGFSQTKKCVLIK